MMMSWQCTIHEGRTDRLLELERVEATQSLRHEPDHLIQADFPWKRQASMTPLCDGKDFGTNDTSLPLIQLTSIFIALIVCDKTFSETRPRRRMGQMIWR